VKADGLLDAHRFEGYNTDEAPIMPTLKIPILWLLVLPCLPACAMFRGEDASKKNTFTEKNLAAGGLGIGGVVSAMTKVDDNGRELAALMRTQIIETRQDFKIVSSSYIERRLGEADYSALLNGYESRGELHPELLAKIRPDLEKRFRFMVFARIDMDTVSTRLKHIGRVDGDTSPSTDYITRREIGIAFQVYDLEKFALVYTTHVTASDERSTRRLDRPLAIERPYPDPPDLREVAVIVFEDFAKRLPGFSEDHPMAE
jgi:hypothetical protein